jgi:hypothetical protein
MPMPAFCAAYGVMSENSTPSTPRGPPRPAAMLDDAGVFFPLSSLVYSQPHSLSGYLGATGRAALTLLTRSLVRIILLWRRHTDEL